MTDWPPPEATDFCNKIGTNRTSRDVRSLVAIGGKRTCRLQAPTSEIDPTAASASLLKCASSSGDARSARGANETAQICGRTDWGRESLVLSSTGSAERARDWIA